MNNKGLVVSTTIGILLITFIFSLEMKHSPIMRKITGSSPELPQEAHLEKQSSTPGGSGQQSNAFESGPVSDFPWDEERTFLEAQTRFSTQVLLAGYRTVLPDPLPGEEENVHLAASYLAGKVVQPGQVFSQNASIGPYTEERGFKTGPTYLGNKMTTTTGGGVCKIASTLYNTAVLSNLTIVERHAHSMPVPYVPYGQDATVSFGYKDFKFLNDTSAPILIWAKGMDNVLYVAFYGRSQPPRVEWMHKREKSFKSYTLYRLNPEFSQGEEKIASEGMDGGLIHSWAKVYREDGTWIIKSLGSSYYSPLPRIVEKGGSTAASSE